MPSPPVVEPDPLVEEGAPRPSRNHLAACVDIGSTFTKALLVDLADGTLLATADHPTTIDTDVLDGVDACLAALAAEDPGAADAQVLACSSAGGGLRIAVVGNEALVTAEAGRRVALSSGGRVVAVHALADGDDLADLAGEAPDLVLLTGGTDGGNPEPLLRAARLLVEQGWSGPVVVAGNADAAAEASRILDTAGGELPHVVAPNVVPVIGRLAPDGARAAIREAFLAHVIGGKHLSSRPDFTRLVRGATPDVVLTGVELLARGLDPDRPGVGDVVVVDVGGATTDVHSVVEVDPERAAGLAREVVADTPVTRTVEGDLGMRWSAPSTVAAAGRGDLVEAAERRRAEPGWVPDPDRPAYDDECDVDEAIAREAAALALRRHAGRSRVVVSPEGRVVERSGTDLREVALLVGSGGVLRHGRPGVAERVLGPVTGEVDGGWQLPRAPRVVVDTDYALAAAGLLAGDHPHAAHRLVDRWASPGG